MISDNTQLKEPQLTTLTSETGGSTNLQSKQARVQQCKS